MAKKPSLKSALAGRKVHEQKIQAKEAKEQRISDAQAAAEKRAKLKAKKTMPFEADDSILLVGEGNFSFTLGLLNQHVFIDKSNQILATSFDSETTCYEKYPDASAIVSAIRAHGVPVLFSVDATDLEATSEIKSRPGGWTRVVFNFPHLGTGEKDQARNVQLNQVMLAKFLRSVAPFLSKGPSRIPVVEPGHGKGKVKAKKVKEKDEDELEGVSDFEELGEGEEGDEAYAIPVEKASWKVQKGTVLVTLRDAVPYTLWDLPRLLTKPKPLPPLHMIPPSQRPPPNTTLPATQPQYRILRSFAFHPTLYPGYSHRRTIGFKEGLSASANEEIEDRGGGRTWEAEVVEESLNKKPTGTDEEEARERKERVEKRREELREEKDKKKSRRGNGYKDHRPKWSAPGQGDEGWQT